jgi:hypothetical protein
LQVRGYPLVTGALLAVFEQKILLRLSRRCSVIKVAVLKEQRGVWIDEVLLRQARLEGQLRVVVGEQEIRLVPAEEEVSRFPYDSAAEVAQAVLKEARDEALGLYGGQMPPADRPYFGGMTWREYQALSDVQRATVWNQLYAQYDVEIEAVEERDVRPDALAAG